MDIDVHKMVITFPFPIERKHVIISQELNQRFRFKRRENCMKNGSGGI